MYVPAFLVFPAIPAPGRLSVVAYLNPAWPWLFLLSGLWLFIAAVLWTRVAYAHVTASAMFACLSAAAFYGTIANQPTGSPAFSIACFLLAGVHFNLAGRTPQ